MEEYIYTDDEEKILEELAKNPPTEAEKNEILSNFAKRLPSIPFKKCIKVPLIGTRIDSFPKCFLRFSRYYDGMFVICCGKRSLVEENFDDIGYTVALAECSQCGGCTTEIITIRKSYLKRSRRSTTTA